ncbi:hypothetical protein ABZV67_43225 [Streptomyces sp. NPDC005065]|uniref:hypothetical protein n=1 Tax=Streptomyces sp. NPDC005065 TaxID=3154461 RepID=UPI0033AE9228
MHIATGLGETLGDQPQRLTGDAEPGRDHLLGIRLTHRGIQRKQHPRTHAEVS